MSIIDIQTLLIAIIVGISCGLIGIFLVLRKMLMMIDAISHTVLLGIVISYIFVRDVTSPFILFGATIIGVVTVFLIELLISTKRVLEDQATGSIFPLLFSIAVILVTTKFRNTHLDNHAIVGNLELAALKQITINNINIGSKTLYISLFVLLIIILFIKIFFKELKIISFDKALAYSLGFSPILIHYLLMSMVSLTAVASFNAVGTILVVAMMIGPAATSLLLTKDLKSALIVSSFIAIVNSLLGYFISMFIFKGKVNISSTIAFTTLIIFLLIWIFEPKKGLVSQIVKRNRQRKNFLFDAFFLHIANPNHFNDSKELNVNNLKNELKYKSEVLNKQLNKAIDLGYININNDIINLTDIGKSFYNLKIKELSREL